MAERRRAPARVEPEPESTDGRLARGQRTRRRVAEALVELLASGDPEPTARQIAERADVSLRLVFHPFEDMEDLYRAVCELQFERHWRVMVSVPATLPLQRRTERLAKVRANLFEDIGPVRRAGIHRAERAPEIGELISATNRLLRQEVADTFAPELAALSRGAAADLLETLDLASSWETWDRLRRVQGLGVTTARRVVSRVLHDAVTVAEGDVPQRRPAAAGL